MTIENIEVEIVGIMPTGNLAGEIYLRGSIIETVGDAGEVMWVLRGVEEWVYARGIALRSSWKYDILTGKFVVAARVPEEWTYDDLPHHRQHGCPSAFRQLA